MPPDTEQSLHDLPLLPLFSISILLPLFIHLLWRLVLSPHKSTRPPPPLNPSGATKKTKKSSLFYNTPTASPDNPTPTTITPLPFSPDTLPTLTPDRWYLDPSLISRDRIYTPTMALRSCSFDDWLRIDANYPARMAHKRNMLARHGWDPVGGAMACRGSGAEGAVRELLGELGAYLVGRFPGLWRSEGDGGRWLRNVVTGDRLEVVEPWGGMHPLEVVARVTEEDLAVLMPGREGGEEEEEEYVLKAAVSAFPAGFDIQEKMDQPLTAIHEPVPMYKEKLRRAMNKFFKKVTADRLVMRVNWGINEREELFFLDGTHLYEGDEASADPNIDVNQVQLRVERQVLRRLPRSGAICMLTKTYLYRLVDIAEEPGVAARLGGMLHKLPEKFAFYKRKPVWGKVVVSYLDEMAAKHPILPTCDE